MYASDGAIAWDPEHIARDSGKENAMRRRLSWMRMMAGALAACVATAAGGAWAAMQSYTVESINDPFFFKYPNPKPRHVHAVPHHFA